MTQTWGHTAATGRRTTVAIVLYLAAGLCGVLLATFGEGMTRVVWGFCAVVFIWLGVTLTIYRSQRT